MEYGIKMDLWHHHLSLHCTPMDKKVLIVSLLTIICWIIYAQNGGELVQSIQRGQEVYANTCKACHQDKGQGMEGVYPPLAKSDFLAKDPKRAIDIVLHGINGEILVNGKKYNLDMPAQSQLTDQQITDVLNFVRNSWGNKGKTITVAQVKASR
jgi:mono/diheme cytochrome c family protein